MGWDRPDFVYLSGDAYVDHPSFGVAIISRLLEYHGYRVAILPQPDWKHPETFLQFGKPKLGFLVTAGNIDSMVAHYTVAKNPVPATILLLVERPGAVRPAYYYLLSNCKIPLSGASSDFGRFRGLFTSVCPL